MQISAEFAFEADAVTVQTIYRSIKEEEQEQGDATRRTAVELELQGQRLHLSLRENDPTRLRAVANTWLRLVKVAYEMVEVIGECGHTPGQ
ncbi:MAG: KEOPS complex subunit Pcc1 [Candidatus Methanospirareceae archaeon]